MERGKYRNITPAERIPSPAKVLRGSFKFHENNLETDSMMMKDKGKLVIWPAYIDLTRSRSNGRIISKKSSVKEPHLKEITEAARQLGLNPEVEPDKAYPKSWWEVSGRVLVDDKGPKSVIAKQIALAIKKMREK